MRAGLLAQSGAGVRHREFCKCSNSDVVSALHDGVYLSLNGFCIGTPADRHVVTLGDLPELRDVI